MKNNRILYQVKNKKGVKVKFTSINENTEQKGNILLVGTKIVIEKNTRDKNGEVDGKLFYDENITFRVLAKHLSQIKKKQIFISCKNEELPIIKGLKKHLETYKKSLRFSRAFQCSFFLDDEIIPPRTNLIGYMKSIIYHDFVIFYISAAFLHSTGCLFEGCLAVENNVPMIMYGMSNSESEIIYPKAKFDNLYSCRTGTEQFVEELSRNITNSSDEVILYTEQHLSHFLNVFGEYINANYQNDKSEGYRNLFNHLKMHELI